MSEMRIGERLVGDDHPPLVIAELGINHGGDLDVAKEMVDAAARAGVEVLKHQTHIPSDEMSGAARKVVPGNADRSIYEIIESCALDEDDEFELMQYVRDRGIEFISTPFSRAAADRLRRFDVPAFKIGSGELNNHPLLAHVASFGKPMVISTGMNDLAAVHKAVAIVRAAGVPFALMHTTNLYPTPPRLVRLGAFAQLRDAFPGVPVGLSDHTTNNNACIAAVALGAAVLERHFTDRMDRIGPDIVNSMDERATAELITGAREVFEMRGGTKEAAPEEQVTIDFAFATVVTIRPVRAGEPFTAENLWVKRPGTGAFRAEEYDSLLGRVAAVDIDDDTQLTEEMVGA
ncbi:N-acetylneuraminate synthase family protein [Nocardioides sp. BP30]|uniref:N-acetylneuraminate synthase family protein n=1 Tax=Nocardioides sp. BP30 TaxID=3036374 RepID=UPI0024688128|nr:N-acetylneuraminate synthase family protein [Nocardioides sp. BP30]WGL51913.1 N-acetylneuraminate synthase family protein [Nocardioides sp. BP30]